MLTATLTIQDNSAKGSESVYLEGDGMRKMVAVANVQPGNLSFKPGDVQSATVTSSGTANLEIGKSAIKGTWEKLYTIRNNSCDGASLAPGKSCRIEVAFSPRAASLSGDKTLLDAVLSFADNTSNGYEQVSLAGQVSLRPPPRPAFTVNPSELHFPDTLVLNRSTPQAVTIFSAGTAPITIIEINLSDPNFVRSPTDCLRATLSPGMSCQFPILFSPQIQGALHATLLIGDGVSPPRAVTLSGTGIALKSTNPPAGWCCNNGEVTESSQIGCARSGGYFSFDQLQARRACVGRDTTSDSGWCCADGKVGLTSREVCGRYRGFFSQNQAETQKVCSANTSDSGWCCADGKVGPTSKEVCGRYHGFFSQNQAETQKACSTNRAGGDNPNDQGWCCANGKFGQTTREVCVRYRGFFSQDQAAVQKACANQGRGETGVDLGWCCVDGKVTQTSQIACSRYRGYFSSDQRQAQGVCSASRGSRIGDARIPIERIAPPKPPNIR
jgi:hypothetical protein